jgi:hypothetical protein
MSASGTWGDLGAAFELLPEDFSVRGSLGGNCGPAELNDYVQVQLAAILRDYSCEGHLHACQERTDSLGDLGTSVSIWASPSLELDSVQLAVDVGRFLGFQIICRIRFLFGVRLRPWPHQKIDWESLRIVFDALFAGPFANAPPIRPYPYACRFPCHHARSEPHPLTR